ncbi:MAG: MFS transporter [Pseudomonadota bacterium]
MLDVLSNRTYGRLFAAQLISLLGTGLATVALALLAYEFGPDAAGSILGTALAIKMVAYVSVAPVASALAQNVERRTLLIALDVIRALIALCLPFVTQIWQVFVLIFLLQSASAAFTPAFQATIPDVLEDEEAYTKALSLSRLAYDLENLISPLLAAAMLSFVGFHWLFAGTAAGFAISALLVLSVALPRLKGLHDKAFAERLTHGVRIFSRTARLRGLMAINLAVAASGALVIVNTVVYVQSEFGMDARATAIALAAFGGGSILVALTLPRVLAHTGDRLVMLAGATLVTLTTAVAALVPNYAMLLVLWALTGIGYAAAQLPVGRLLRRSAAASDRPAVFAAQFALSHACWLITYPVAGWIGNAAGLSVVALVLSILCAIGSIAAVLAWPAETEKPIAHAHHDLPADHPHLTQGDLLGPNRHRHPQIVDELHGTRTWAD